MTSTRQNGRPEEGYIVGLGASAGGYEALEKFFDHVPPDSGMAFVVVQHLSPDYKSLMVELLSKHTQMSVKRVEDGMAVEPDTVYLIPPKKTMTIFHRTLYLSEINMAYGIHLPINIFFRALAEDVQSRAVGVIFSGTGSDGTLGIRDIKGAGGFVLVQEPESAKFDGMPKSALASGLVDYVLEPQAMPDVLVKFVNHLHITQQNVSDIMRGEHVDALTNILHLIKQQKNFDFTQYKPSTIIRRIEKRMGINQVDDIDEYIGFLQVTPEEITTLAGELLINVTKFFRDPEVFDFLKTRVLPGIFQNRKGNAPLRVWVPACSTGEEAYSLAIIFREYMEEQGEHAEVKIFATDIDRPSLEVASAGTYSESIVADVSKERLEKYFLRKNHHFQVGKSLRAMVIFAYQNLLKDAPFNKIDLVTCRNLLIYFQEQAQRRALGYIHFALNPNGYLFLGKSESIGDMVSHFVSISTKWKIWQKQGNQPLPLSDRQYLFTPRRTAASSLSVVSAPAPQPSQATQRQFEAIYHELMRLYEPAAMLINADDEVLYYFGDMSHFLATPHGRAEQHILKVLREDLSVAVSTAIHRVRKERKEVVYKDIALRRGQETIQCDLVVKPAGKPDQDVSTLFVILEEVLPAHADSGEVEVYNQYAQSNQRIKDLENELQITKENLQATVEELETSNEELQATNEELLAANEELQSTNEELQSVNEELVTVNSEYQGKFEELIRMTNDFDSLLNSTQIAMLFLDNELLIRKFTPNIVGLLNLVDGDVGRPISHLTLNFEYGGFLDDLRRVLESGVTVEREIRTAAHGWHALRILPYRAVDDEIEGVTVSLLDINEHKQLESSLRTSEEQFRLAFENAPHGMALVSPEGTWLKVNRALCRLTGYTCEELQALDLESTSHPDDLSQELRYVRHALAGQRDAYQMEKRYRHKQGHDVWALLSVSLVRDADGEPRHFVAQILDITAQKMADAALEQMDNLGTWEWNLSTGDLIWSDAVYAMFGLSRDHGQPTHADFLECVHPDDRQLVERELNKCREQQGEHRVEYRIVRPDGTVRWVLETGGVLRDDDGTPRRMIGMAQDISDYKALQAMREQAPASVAPPLQILLVEDDPLDITAMQRVLPNTDIHYHLEVTRDGEAALAWLRHCVTETGSPLPDVILLDLNLPGMGGIEVLQAIREHAHWKRIPVVIVSGSSLPDDVVQTWHLEGDAYLTKPYSAAQLFMALNAAMAPHQWFVLIKPSQEEKMP